MSIRELDRSELMRRIAERRLTQRQVADQLGLSVRQVERLYRAYRADGPAGLVSRKRGRPSNRKLPDAVRAQALELVRAHYADFGPTLAHEKLAEVHAMTLSVETLRRWMVEAGLWKSRAAARARAHPPRLRRACFGELVQVDGCEHAWFEDRGEVCTLLVFVDDATSRLVGLRFARSESTFDYFALTREYLERHGKPVAFYSDKASVFRVNAKDPKAGDGFTQFGRAMHELNIDVMCANTAPAKGRVERAHLTLQDRLVKELRLRGVRSIEEGNAYLPGFMADYNRRFGRAPRNEHDAHRPLLSVECARLDDIFRWREQRKVSASRTLHYNRVLYVLDDTEAADRARGQRVDVYESHDGAVSIRFEGVELTARAFAKDGPALQAPVVDNKLLSAAIDYAQKLQRERLEQRLASQRLTLRDRRLLEAQLQELSARNSPVA